MAVVAVFSRQEPVQGVHQVVVRARADLQDDEAGRGVRHEDGQEAIGAARGVREKGRAGRRQIGDPPGRARPDAELTRLYGKMLRSASRSRPILPPAGADSYRSGSPPASVVAPHWSRPTLVL